jgi:hypothetical protein
MQYLLEKNTDGGGLILRDAATSNVLGYYPASSSLEINGDGSCAVTSGKDKAFTFFFDSIHPDYRLGAANMEEFVQAIISLGIFGSPTDATSSQPVTTAIIEADITLPQMLPNTYFTCTEHLFSGEDAWWSIQFINGSDVACKLAIDLYTEAGVFVRALLSTLVAASGGMYILANTAVVSYGYKAVVRLRFNGTATSAGHTRAVLSVKRHY